jgi:hypothetical protein
MREVFRTQDLGHALLMRATLEAAGIEAVVHGQTAAEHIYAGGVSLQVVHDSDLAEALRLVGEAETEREASSG